MGIFSDSGAGGRPSSDLLRTEDGLTPRQRRRSLDRHTTALEAQTEKKLAVIAAEADLQVTRARAVNHVGTKAMQSVALMSEMEAQLTKLAPHAAGRLQAIGDITALATAEVVADTVRKVSR